MGPWALAFSCAATGEARCVDQVFREGLWEEGTPYRMGGARLGLWERSAFGRTTGQRC